MSSVKRQLIVFGCLMLASLISLALFANAIHDRSHAINSNWLPSVMHVSNINTLTSDFRINELEHILSVSEDQMRSYENRMEFIKQRIQDEMKAYEPLITTANEKILYAGFVTQWNEYLEQHRLMIPLSKDNRTEQAKIMIRAKSESLFHSYSASLIALVAENRTLAHQETENGRQLLFLTGLNLFLVLGLLIYFVYRTAQHFKTMFDRVLTRCVTIMTDISV